VTAIARSGVGRARWLLFGALAILVIVVDQITKSVVVSSLAVGQRVDILDGYVRIVHSRNSGILFGMLPDSAPAFAAASLLVLGLIVFYESRAGRGIVTTVALGLLLGGAIGNLLDRLRYGSVVDFVDLGVGTIRWYTFNVADAAISTALVLLIALALFPRLGELGVSDGD
jgi:signal peptidase II